MTAFAVCSVATPKESFVSSRLSQWKDPTLEIDDAMTAVLCFAVEGHAGLLCCRQRHRTNGPCAQPRYRIVGILVSCVSGSFAGTSTSVRGSFAAQDTHSRCLWTPTPRASLESERRDKLNSGGVVDPKAPLLISSAFAAKLNMSESPCRQNWATMGFSLLGDISCSTRQPPRFCARSSMKYAKASHSARSAHVLTWLRRFSRLPPEARHLPRA